MAYLESITVEVVHVIVELQHNRITCAGVQEKSQTIDKIQCHRTNGGDIGTVY